MLFAACASASAAPLLGHDDLRRNGMLSRHLWTPDAARTEVMGLSLSAGLAVGVRPGFRKAVGGRLAPAITLQLDRRSNFTVLATGRGRVAVAWNVTESTPSR
jgi:hypothetical protein